MIGGILETCEIEGFLANLHLVEGEGDRDRQAWTGFLGSLLAPPKFTMDKPMTIAEITDYYASVEQEMRMG